MLETARPAERLALEVAAAIAGKRILCTTLGRAQAARALAGGRPEAKVACWFLDLYQQQLAAAEELSPANLSLPCLADAPAAALDLAVVPLSRGGEAELSRDVLQSACERLAIGGTLVSAVDSTADRWLHEQMSQLFDKVTVKPFDDGVVYVARKTDELRKVRDFRCELTFRDGPRLVRAVTRPGVFSHRRLDAGTRQLIAASDLPAGARILDIGCGAGTVGLALAARDATAAIHGIDSNARAVECTLAGAALNELTNVTAELNCDGRLSDEGQYDFAVANPPYYADFRIAEHFLETAHRALRLGGRVLVVTKRAGWYVEAMPGAWQRVAHWPSKRYQLVSAVRA